MNEMESKADVRRIWTLRILGTFIVVNILLFDLLCLSSLVRQVSRHWMGITFFTISAALTLWAGFVFIFKQRAGAWGTIVLMVPILILVAFIAKDPFLSVASGRLPGYVLSGRLFTDKFDIGHAGCALDQPTIGKWLFWFTVMTCVSFPYTAMVRWISNRKSQFEYLAFIIPASIICVLLLCILSWPVCWLIQYVLSMGITTKRLFGLAYGIIAVVAVLRFLTWSSRRPKQSCFLT